MVITARGQRRHHQSQVRSFFYICCVWQALKGAARVVVMTFPFQITRKWWFIAYFSFETAFSLRILRTRLNWRFIMLLHESSLWMKTCRQFWVVRGWMNGKWDVSGTIIITQRDNWKKTWSLFWSKIDSITLDVHHQTSRQWDWLFFGGRLHNYLDLMAACCVWNRNVLKFGV